MTEASKNNPRPTPSCPHCWGDLFPAFDIFDPGKNKTFRVFECERCHKRVWEDEIA